MSLSDYAPATALAVLITTVLAGTQLLPVGRGMLLVRVPDGGAEGALAAAAWADATLVSTPAPGFAVLYGDASQVRRALGLAVTWKGLAPCLPNP